MKNKIIISILLFTLLPFSLAKADDLSDVKTYVNNMRSATSQIWILWNIFVKIFDTNWRIKSTFFDFLANVTNWYIPYMNAWSFTNSPIFINGWNVGISSNLSLKSLNGGILNLQTSDDSWLYTQWLKNDWTRKLRMWLDWSLSSFNIWLENWTNSFNINGWNVWIWTTSPGVKLEVSDWREHKIRLRSNASQLTDFVKRSNWTFNIRNWDQNLSWNWKHWISLDTNWKVWIWTEYPDSTLSVIWTIKWKDPAWNYWNALINQDWRMWRMNVGDWYIEAMLDWSYYWISIWASDERYKSSIKKSNYNALNDIEKMDFKSFYHNIEKRPWNLWLIAQDLQKINKDYVNEMSDWYLNPDLPHLLITSLKANQELKKENKEQQKQITDLTKRLERLEQK